MKVKQIMIAVVHCLLMIHNVVVMFLLIQEIDGNYVQTQRIQNDNIDTDDQFGSKLQVLDTNEIYVGMSNDDKKSTSIQVQL